jgi:hypothetical protein
LLDPTYTFATPVLGGQLAIGIGPLVGFLFPVGDMQDPSI